MKKLLDKVKLKDEIIVSEIVVNMAWMWTDDNVNWHAVVKNIYIYNSCSWIKILVKCCTVAL